MGFQSLLSWIRLLGRSAAIGLAVGGFNPCCLGSGCSAELSRACRLKGVSILVVLDQAARHALRVDVRRRAVSILVVLDQAARLVRRIDGSVTLSFNPCCLGSGCSAMRGSLGRWIAAGFNPCCLGSGCSARSSGRHRGWTMGFQSLLSWIRLLGLPGTCSRRPSGFNPCCLGSGCSAPVDAALSRRSRVSILVVLDQAARPVTVRHAHSTIGVSILVVLDQAARHAGRALIAAQATGFNPCCLGSGCSAGRRWRHRVMEFQSLLSWIRLLGWTPQPCYA